MEEKKAHDLAVAMTKGIMGRDYREAAEPAENKLLPCPFCGGGKTEMKIYNKGKIYKGVIYHDCIDGFYLPLMDRDEYLTAEQAEKKIIEAWNRRANNDN